MTDPGRQPWVAATASVAEPERTILPFAEVTFTLEPGTDCRIVEESNFGIQRHLYIDNANRILLPASKMVTLVEPSSLPRI